MSIALVRVLTGDSPQYQSAVSTGDGASIDFQLPNAPIYPGSLRVVLGSILQTEGLQYTADYESGLVTFLTPPANGVAVKISSKYTMLSDTQIQTLLDQYTGSDGDSKLAAADALDIIASSEAMIEKKIDLLDMKTDGPAVANALRAHAKILREQASIDESSFELIEMVYDEYSYTEKILKDWMREG